MKSQVLPFLILMILYWGCSSDASKNTQPENDDSADQSSNWNNQEEPVKDIESALKEVEKAVKGAQGENAKEPVNFRELKKLLPNRVLGLDETDSSGETTGMFGIKVSHAEKTYTEGNKRIKITITDVNGMVGALMGLAPWSSMEFDKESSDGIERTTTIQGHKAFEKYNNNSESGEISVIVDGRYIVQVQGDNVSLKDIRNALEEVDLKLL